MYKLTCILMFCLLYIILYYCYTSAFTHIILSAFIFSLPSVLSVDLHISAAAANCVSKGEINFLLRNMFFPPQLVLAGKKRCT